MPLAEGQRFADFEIIAKLGQGGMGAVYQARQTVLKRLVAIKVLAPVLAADEAFIRRFEAEAAAAANLSHPNIVQVYAAGVSEDIHYIAMEFVEGPTLRARLEQVGRLDPEQVLEIAYQVALALDQGWTKAQLIHRDIKPDNIFLAANGVIKLGDFGLAKTVGGDGNFTLSGQVMGSPHYISPEQARSDATIDFRADIYSLGCTLYQAITGRRVYEGDSALNAILKHVNEPPPSVLDDRPDCPPALAALVHRMLAKAAEDRPQSYDELIAEILRIRQELEQGILSTPEPDAASRAPAAPRRTGRILSWAVAILLMAGAGGLGWWGFRTWQERAIAESRREDEAAVRAFARLVESLPPDQQVDKVMAKLRERNPGFTSKERYAIEDDQVVELSLSALNLEKIWPVAALRNLRKLQCTGDSQEPRQGNLSDLSALRGLVLREFDCSWTKVQSLEPLREMSLTTLRCAHTSIRDLAPLKGMLLVELDCSNTAVRDLSPLAGMPLKSLACEQAPVLSLAPLQDMPIRSLRCDPRALRDRDVLRSLKQLEEVNGHPLNQMLRGPKLGEGKFRPGPEPR